jgi:hypothetical protein
LVIKKVVASTLESPGIIKRSGVGYLKALRLTGVFTILTQVYYLFASHTTGWDPNPNKFFTASASLIIPHTTLLI